MLNPTVRCSLCQTTGYDESGKETLSRKVFTYCQPVHYRIEEKPSSVRADSSASRGRAAQETATVRLLFLPKDKLAIDMFVQLVERPDERFRVVEVYPRFDVFGQLDHYQVDCERDR